MLLERKAIDFTVDVDSDILNKAKRVLEYDQFESRFDADLRKTMKDLDVQPFTADSVAKYKASKERKKLENICIATFIISGLTLIGSMIFLFVSLQAEDLLISIRLNVSIIVSAVIGIVLSMALAPKTAMRWRTVELKDYRKPVPEFALQTALDIKEKCPYARFFIDELTEIEDPFLIVSTGNLQDIQTGANCYYVEVWNEPGFKKIREV